MVLSIFGAIDKEAALEKAKEYFGRLPSGTPLSLESMSVPAQEPRMAFESMNKEQLAILIGFPGKTVDDPARYPLGILAGSLNSQGGKLFQVLRDERGLAYSVGAFDILGVEPGAFVFYIVTDPLKADAAIHGMFEIIDDLRRNGMSEADLGRTKSEVMGRHAIDLQTNGQLAAVAAFDELYGLGYDAYKEYDARMRAVTTDDVKRVAADVLNLDRHVLIAVGNLGSEEALQSAAAAAASQFGAAQ
jgi:zinc protease